MDWTNKNVHPAKVVSLGDGRSQDPRDRRGPAPHSLGMKRRMPNPWKSSR
jgi:hypothetical protein